MIPATLRRPLFWVLAAIVVTAAIMRFWGIHFGLPHTQARPDETVIIDAALDLLSGRLPHFYDYPWLFIWMTSLGYLCYYVWGLVGGAFNSIADLVASWPLHWEPFFLIGRFLSAALGTVSVLVVFRIGRQVRDELTGVVAALFLALTFMHVRNSHFGTTDVAMTFLILCAVTLIIDAHRTGRRDHAAAAGALSGLAAATKYNAILLVVPALVSYVLTIVDRPAESRRAAMLDRNVLYFTVPFVLAFLVGAPFLLFDQASFLIAMGDLRKALATGDPRLGLTNGWLHHLRYSLHYGLGLPLLVGGLAGSALLLASNFRIGLLMLAFPISYYAVAGSVDLLFFRYVLPTVPFLCISAAYLVRRAHDLFSSALRAQPMLATAMTGLMAFSIVYPSARSSWQFNRILSQTDNRVLVSEWFAAYVPPESSVLQSGARYGHAQFERRFRYKIWQWDGGRRAFMLDGRRAQGRPDWILIQDSPLPSTTQPIVREYLKDGYTHVTDFIALTIDDDLVYDRLDAFYVPFGGFDRVERPGPNFALYKRNGAIDTAAPKLK